MAKKDSKKKEKRAAGGGPQDAVEAVRAAVERTFQASAEGAQSTRERTRELIDEVASAATRVRQTFEELRVLDELKGLRGEVEALARRVSELEAAGRAGAPTSGRTASTRRAMTAAGGGRSSAAGGGTRSAAAGGARKSSAASSTRSGSTRSARSSAAKSSSTAGRAAGSRSRRTTPDSPAAGDGGSSA